jgi:cytidylate kinase
MSVITIRGHMGSGAPEIGKLVANGIHADYVDREIIAEVAERLKWSKQGVEEKEKPAGTLGGRILEALEISGAYQGAVLPTWEIPLDDTRYLAGLMSVIKELARSQSIVIRGRGSQFILKDYPGAFHVLVVAPLETRLERVMNDMAIDEEHARKDVERFDNSRREFTKRYFNAELEEPLHYDLVINTSHLTFEDAASIVVNATPFKERRA